MPHTSLLSRITLSFGIAIVGTLVSPAFSTSPLPPSSPSLPLAGTAQAKDVTPAYRAAASLSSAASARAQKRTAAANGTIIRRGTTYTSPLIPTVKAVPKAPVKRIAANSAPNTPVRIRIPSIGVDANVETLGLLPDGQLDVPKAVDAAGWYTRSPKPGEKGKAIIDGHLDIGSTPGVFWDLKHVQVGEEIMVQDAQGTERTFRVQRTAVYDVDNAPMQEIFAGGDTSLLNIITCAGVWREELDHYDKRLIVYAELVTDAPTSNVALR